MLGRFITFAVIVTAGAVGMVGFADGPPVAAPASSHGDQSNFTTQARGRSSWSSASVAASPSGEARLTRAPDSHFYADVEIDGRQVRMMVDSGASMIALTRRDAEAVGIDVDRLPVGGMAQTAGGQVPMRITMLRSVEVDGIEVRGVQAAVIDADMGISLLGQSYLAKLGKVNVEGDTMTLR